MSKALMVLGCTSDAGKSMLATALCRIFADMGLKVALLSHKTWRSTAQ